LQHDAGQAEPPEAHAAAVEELTAIGRGHGRRS
jgi:hypothetical protein